VQLVKRQYLVVTLPSAADAVAVVATGELGASEALRRVFQYGQGLQVALHRAPLHLTKKQASAGCVSPPREGRRVRAALADPSMVPA